MDVVGELWAQGPWMRAFLTVLAGVLGAGVVWMVFRRWFGWLTAQTETEVDDFVVARLQRPMSWTILIGSVWYASHGFDTPAPFPFLRDGVLFSFLVVVWTLASGRIMGHLLDHLLEHHERFVMVTPRTLPFFDLAGKVFVFGGGIYFFFLAWDIDVAGWLAGAGIVGIAVGFAAQDTLSNLIAGLFILADAPYQLGDYLQLENGTRGRVTEIGFRTTRLVTRDDIEVIVPNATMATSTITNESGGPYVKHRIKAFVGVGYDSDPAEVKGILAEIPRGIPGVAEVPRPRAQLIAFGASSLDFRLMVWIDEPELRGRVLDLLHMRILERFREAGIEIPFNQVDLNVKELPGSADGPTN